MIPTLSCKDLILKQQTRPFAALVEWLNDAETMQYSEQRHITHTMSSCQRYINSFNGETNHLWQIQNMAGEIVGTISAQRDPENRIVSDMGVLIGRPFWNRGYACQAWQKISDWLLSDDKIRKIEAGTMATNLAMQKVFAKTGMKPDGERKNHYWVNSAPVNLLYFARFK